MNSMKTLLAAVLIAGLAIESQAAQISPALKSGFYSSVSLTINGTAKSVSAGTINIGQTGISGMPASFEGYCVDLLDVVASTPYDVNPISTTFLSNGNRAAWLYSHYGTTSFGTKVATADDAAALQVALWDVVYDNGDGLSNGNFKITSASSAIMTKAQSYLTASAGMIDSATYLKAVSHPGNTNQDMIGPYTLGSQSVPEPSTYAFFGASVIGMMGFVKRKKR